MSALKWVIVKPLEDPCPACAGSGGYWKERQDGKPDRRFRYPLGPCPACDGTGGR